MEERRSGTPPLLWLSRPREEGRAKRSLVPNQDPQVFLLDLSPLFIHFFSFIRARFGLFCAAATAKKKEKKEPSCLYSRLLKAGEGLGGAGDGGGGTWSAFRSKDRWEPAFKRKQKERPKVREEETLYLFIFF